MRDTHTDTADSCVGGDIAVNVAAGSGRIARRRQAVLFDPSGDSGDLIAAFDRAPSDQEAVTAVKQHLIETAFAGPPVVLVDWRAGELDLLVFGDAQVHSSVSAAPMISGSGSGTWIERHLGALELGAEAHVWSGDETDGATDLRLGIARGGGIRVVVTRAAESMVGEIPPADPEEHNPRPVPAPAPAATNGSSPPSGPTGPAPGTEPSRFASPAPASRPAQAPAAHSGAVATATDPFTDPTGEAFEDQLTEPADRIAGLAEVRSAASGLVEALHCPNGHSNPPQYLLCRICAVDIDPDAAVELIAQPSVGHLRFEHGEVVEVDGPRIIGRKPGATDGAMRPVIVDHVEVSRNHAEVTLEGWSVLVTDVGSRNGTWVIPPSDPTPMKLDSGMPYLLEHGTTVHLGGPEAGFTYDFGID